MCGVTVEAFSQLFRENSQSGLSKNIRMCGLHIKKFDPSGNQSAPAEELIVAIEGEFGRATKQGQPPRIKLRLIPRSGERVRIFDPYPAPWKRATQQMEESIGCSGRFRSDAVPERSRRVFTGNCYLELGPVNSEALVK